MTRPHDHDFGKELEDLIASMPPALQETAKKHVGDMLEAEYDGVAPTTSDIIIVEHRHAKRRQTDIALQFLNVFIVGHLEKNHGTPSAEEAISIMGRALSDGRIESGSDDPIVQAIQGCILYQQRGSFDCDCDEALSGMIAPAAILATQITRFGEVVQMILDARAEGTDPEESVFVESTAIGTAIQMMQGRMKEILLP